MADAKKQQEIKRLEEDVSRYVEMVHKLLHHDESSHLAIPGQFMKKSDFAKCHGVMFTTAFKAGIGFGYQHGYGFVITKLPSKSSVPVWSGPMFIKLNAGSLGATLGVSKIDSMMILGSERAVEAFRKEVMELKTNIAGSVGIAIGPDQPAAQRNLQEGAVIGNVLQEGSMEEKSFSMASGAIIDISLKSMRYNVDMERNSMFYGDNATPASIMNGDYPIPTPKMQDLYNVLNKAMEME